MVAQPHCHHHAVIGWAADQRLLERAGATVTQVAGCCGLAGNFGMEKGHYEVSVAVAETHLLPAVRANPGAVVLADGMSCRVQLDDLAGDPTMHLAELLASRLDRVNPRHRRLVIPVALVGLLLIVVIAAVRQTDDRAPAPRADPAARAASSTPTCWSARSRPGGRRARQPTWRRVELRYVDLKAGRHLQVTTYDETQAHTANHAVGRRGPRRRRRPARRAVRQLARRDHHGDPPAAGDQEGRGASCTPTDRAAAGRGRPRPRPRQAAAAARGRPGVPGARPRRRRRPAQAEPAGEVPPGRGVPAAARHRRSPRRIDKGQLRRPTAEEPLRVVDLGCGNAYLTFAAERYLAGVRGLPVQLIGVDVKEQSREHNAAVAAELGVDAEFVVGTIGGVELDPAPEVVLALHACDTATDEALARAVEWERPLVLAAPCCHHDIAAQLRRRRPPRRTPCSPGTASCASGSPTP